MKNNAKRLVIMAALGIAPGVFMSLPATAQTLESTGGGGFKMTSADGAFSSQFGGRIQLQGNAFHDRDAAATNSGGTKLRRVWLYAAGTLYDDWKGKVEIGFADGGGADIENAYIDYTGFAKYFINDVLIGQTKPPFGLEELTSSNYITFIERNITSGAISLGFQKIFTVAGSNDFFHYRVAAYDLDNGENGSAGGGGANGVGNSIGYGARFTVAPLHAEGEVLHLGVAGAYEPNNGLAIRTRPEARLADVITITGAQSDRSDRTKYGFEAAGVAGPFSIQGEYQHARLDADSGPGQNIDIEGYYGFATFFLTGESRPYNAASGTFGRVQPKNDFGAFELAVRYSRLRNQDGPGNIENYTAGANWYVKSNIRFALNFVRANITDATNTQRDTDAYIGQIFYDF